MNNEVELKEDSILKEISLLNTDKAIKESEELFSLGYKVKDYYINILLQSLVGYSCTKSREECLWDLYLRESVVNTLLELSNLFRLKEKHKKRKTRIIIASPVKGLDVFAKLYAAYFKLFGFDVVYLGDLLNNKDFLNSVSVLNPDYVCFHVSNKASMVNIAHFNKKLTNYKNIKTIITSDYPLSSSNLEQLNFHYYIKSLEEIESFGG